MVTNVLLAGVGGQGIITASRVLAHAALISEYDLKKSEVHGMSQRGGSVESHVRFSRNKDLHSPLIPNGEVGILLGFEPVEALRAIPSTAPDAVVIVQDRSIVPTSVTCGPFEYPQDVLESLREARENVHIVNSFEKAVELGEPRAANVVLLGAASCFMDFERDAWEEAIKHSMKPKAVHINLQAFQAGIDILDSE